MNEAKEEETPYQLWREQVTPAPQTIPISSISVIVPLDNADPWCGQIYFIPQSTIIKTSQTPPCQLQQLSIENARTFSTATITTTMPDCASPRTGKAQKKPETYINKGIPLVMKETDSNPLHWRVPTCRLWDLDHFYQLAFLSLCFTARF